MFFEPGESESLSRYVFRMWVVAYLPTVAIGFLLYWLVPDMANSSFQAIPENNFGWALMAVTIGPFVETLVLALFVKLASFVFDDDNAIAIASAIFWAFLHSLAWAPWGLVVAWSFYVMTRSFLAWREQGLFTAIWVTSCIHAAFNLIAAFSSLFA